MLHRVMDHTNSVHVCADDRLTSLSAIGFSGTICDIFSAVLNGACAVPIDLRTQGFTNLADKMRRNAITVYDSVATVFRQYIKTLNVSDRFPNLRIIRLGGEAVKSVEVDGYKRHSPRHCILVAGFGAAESPTYARYFVDKETEVIGGSVPAGYAVDGKSVFLADENVGEGGLDPVGEILVKSLFHSTGYWRRPDLTAQSFLPDPEGGEERIYVTGDLGRMRSDGCLIHLGRKDFQVKIRGFRVEVAEVESALLSVDSVKEAAVIQREDRPGDQRLVAYVVPAIHPAPPAISLRRALAETLPDHMIPSAFVPLDTLPMTPNGKLDRRGLPAPGTERPELNSPFVAPRTPVEDKLASIWAQVLGLNDVGIHDNFLDLGGHSLLATQLISRVITDFEVELPLQSLFGAPTVADMAVAITQSQAEKAGQAGIERILADLETLSDEQVDRLPAHDR